MSIKDYIQGKRQGKEANKLERKAMNDAFLQDALDGFDAVQGNHLPVIEALEKRISAQKSTKRITPVWRYAAAVIAFLIIGTSLLYILNPVNENLPQTADVKKPEIKILTTKPIDTLIVAQKIEIKPVKKQHKKTQKSTTISNDKIDSVISNNTLKDIDVIGYQSNKKISSGYANATATVRAEELGFGTLPDSTNDLFGYLPAKNEQLDTALSGKIAGLDINDSNVDTFLRGNTSGIIAASQNQEKSNIRIRGISSIKDNPPTKMAKGRILGEDGEPLIGAQVMVKNTYNGTVTNINGEFSIPIVNVNNDSTLVASYIGYEKEEIPIKENVGDIKLLADNKTLNEVVTIGYGIQKKGIFSKKHRFQETEFIEYFKKNYNKNIVCEETKITIEATFTLDESGYPTEIEEVKTNCPEIESEVEKWLDKSPRWSKKDRKITLKFSIKQ